MRLLFFFLFYSVSVCPVFPNLTNLVRETFSGYGTNTASITGAFNVVSGTWNRRAVGPRLSNDTTAASLGWSSRMDNTANASAYFQVSNVWTAAASNGYFGAWYWVDSFPSAGGGGSIMILVNTTGNNVVNMSLTSTGGVIFSSQVGPPFNGTIDIIQARKWYWFAMEWHKLNSFNQNHDIRVYRRSIDESSATLIQAWTNAGANGDMATVGPYNGAGSFRFSGRIGMPSLYQTANIGDGATLPTDFVDPPTNAITWYVNAASGNDTNSGVMPAEAWLSAGKINEEAQTAGLIAASNYSRGPTLVIDTSTAVMDLSRTNLTLATSGLNVKATNSVYWTNLLCQTLTNSAFTAHGLPNLYRITVVNAAGFGQSNTVAWEDDKWMNHATGTTFTAVSNYLTTTAGSFWTDGSTNYIHPFGDTVPTSDGKSYTRSVARDTQGSASAINLNGSDMNFRDCFAGKTCMARPTDNDPLGAYVVGTGGNFGGTSVVANCYLYYGAKHILGLVADANNSNVLISDVQAEQDSPYGSQSPFVSFMSLAASSNNTHRYLRCTCLMNSGAIGSTSGVTDSQSVMLMHNSGSGINFRDVFFDSCLLGGQASFAICTNATITNCVLGGVQLNASLSNICINTKFTGIGLDLQFNTTSNTIVRNCIAHHTNFYNVGNWTGWLIKGANVSIENCTMDFSATSDSTPSGHRGMMFRKGPLPLFTFRNNLAIMGTNQNAVFQNFTTNDVTYSISNNVYQLGSASATSTGYTNGASGSDLTLAQWQALGFDVNTVTDPNPRVDTKYNLLGDSRSKTSGVDVGPSVDFTGALFGNRRSSGAMEYRTKRSFSP